MSLQSYNPHDRYRQRAAKRMTSMLSVAFFFLLVFGSGYWVGEMRTEQRSYIILEEARILREAHQQAQNEMTELRAKAQTANVRLEQVRASNEELLSKGPMQDLVALLRKQLDKGVGPKRLEAVIISARPPQNCSDAKSRRFVVITPVYKGPNSTVFIKSGAVTIAGTGAAAQNFQSKKEAWFDPSQPVELTFERTGDAKIIKSGMLPIYHSMVIGDKEYRFTITKGTKSFAKVIYDYCDYP